MNPPMVIVLDQNNLNSYLGELTDILHQCVHDGASVSFILPFSKENSRNYWLENVLPKMKDSSNIVFVAKKDGYIAGTVQLDCNTPENQPHRAEISKLLVSPKFQRQGIAKQLMNTLEEYAVNIGLNLLTLDTRTGDNAEPLYLSLGYEIAGVIPCFARDPIVERYDPTTLMFKKLKH